MAWLTSYTLANVRDHDFRLAIPNPKTRAKLTSDAEYAKFTLRDKGIWTTKARARY